MEFNRKTQTVKSFARDMKMGNTICSINYSEKKDNGKIMSRAY